MRARCHHAPIIETMRHHLYPVWLALVSCLVELVEASLAIRWGGHDRCSVRGEMTIGIEVRCLSWMAVSGRVI